MLSICVFLYGPKSGIQIIFEKTRFSTWCGQTLKEIRRPRTCYLVLRMFNLCFIRCASFLFRILVANVALAVSTHNKVTRKDFAARAFLLSSVFSLKFSVMYLPRVFGLWLGKSDSCRPVSDLKLQMWQHDPGQKQRCEYHEMWTQVSRNTRRNFSKIVWLSDCRFTLSDHAIRPRMWPWQNSAVNSEAGQGFLNAPTF